MAINKHWTKFLPEAGRVIITKGDEQEVLKERIRKMEKELSRLRLQYETQEDFITADIRDHWTTGEISAAKMSANIPIADNITADVSSHVLREKVIKRFNDAFDSELSKKALEDI